MPISEVADYLMSALTVNEVIYPVPPSPAAIFLADSAGPPGGHSSDEVGMVYHARKRGRSWRCPCGRSHVEGGGGSGKREVREGERYKEIQREAGGLL